MKIRRCLIPFSYEVLRSVHTAQPPAPLKYNQFVFSEKNPRNPNRSTDTFLLGGPTELVPLDERGHEESSSESFGNAVVPLRRWARDANETCVSHVLRVGTSDLFGHISGYKPETSKSASRIIGNSDLELEHLNSYVCLYRNTDSNWRQLLLQEVGNTYAAETRARHANISLKHLIQHGHKRYIIPISLSTVIFPLSFVDYYSFITRHGNLISSGKTVTLIRHIGTIIDSFEEHYRYRRYLKYKFDHGVGQVHNLNGDISNDAYGGCDILDDIFGKRNGRTSGGNDDGEGPRCFADRAREADYAEGFRDYFDLYDNGYYTERSKHRFDRVIKYSSGREGEKECNTNIFYGRRRMQRGVVSIHQVKGSGSHFSRRTMLWQHSRRVGAIQSQMPATNFECFDPREVGKSCASIIASDDRAVFNTLVSPGSIVDSADARAVFSARADGKSAEQTIKTTFGATVDDLVFVLENPYNSGAIGEGIFKNPQPDFASQNGSYEHSSGDSTEEVSQVNALLDEEEKASNEEGIIFDIKTGKYVFKNYTRTEPNTCIVGKGLRSNAIITSAEVSGAASTVPTHLDNNTKKFIRALTQVQRFSKDAATSQSAHSDIDTCTNETNDDEEDAGIPIHINDDNYSRTTDNSMTHYVENNFYCSLSAVMEALHQACYLVCAANGLVRGDVQIENNSGSHSRAILTKKEPLYLLASSCRTKYPHISVEVDLPFKIQLSKPQLLYVNNKSFFNDFKFSGACREPRKSRGEQRNLVEILDEEARTCVNTPFEAVRQAFYNPADKINVEDVVERMRHEEYIDRTDAVIPSSNIGAPMIRGVSVGDFDYKTQEMDQLRDRYEAEQAVGSSEIETGNYLFDFRLGKLVSQRYLQSGESPALNKNSNNGVKSPPSVDSVETSSKLLDKNTVLDHATQLRQGILDGSDVLKLHRKQAKQQRTVVVILIEYAIIQGCAFYNYDNDMPSARSSRYWSQRDSTAYYGHLYLVRGGHIADDFDNTSYIKAGNCFLTEFLKDSASLPPSVGQREFKESPENKPVNSNLEENYVPSVHANVIPTEFFSNPVDEISEQNSPPPKNLKLNKGKTASRHHGKSRVLGESKENTIINNEMMESSEETKKLKDYYRKMLQSRSPSSGFKRSSEVRVRIKETITELKKLNEKEKTALNIEKKAGVF